MSETLGDALLTIRTDDGGFDRGIAAAHGKARQLGATFDKTAASSGKLSQGLAVAGRAADGAAGQFQRTGTAVVNTSNSQRAAMSQLSVQLGDMATMYALGARPATIFASQMGQVVGVVQQLTGGTSKLANFLGGPWGIAVMIAVQVLAPFIGKLFETEDAMKAVELASDGMSSAQSAMGEIFDTVTGKIANQNAMLRLNAQLLAINLKAEASVARTKAEGAADSAGERSWMGWLRYNAMAAATRSGGGDFGRSNDTEAKRRLQAILDEKDPQKAARIASAAATWATSADFSQVNISREEYLNAVSDAASAGAKDATAAAIEKSLSSGELDPMFIEPGRDGSGRGRGGGRTGRDRAAETAARHADEVSRLAAEELRAKLALATDAEERAAIQSDLLNLEREDRVRQIEADETLSDAQKAAQLAYIDRLYGKMAPVGENGEIVVQPGGLLDEPIRRELRERETALANDALARQAAALLSQADIAVSLDERDALERRALEIQQQIETNLLEQDIAAGRIADADAASAALAEQQAADRARLRLSQMSPLEAYRYEIDRTAANMDRAIEEIEVRGLQSLNDGIADAIMGARSLGEVFDDVANQIVASLLRIAIQQEIIKPLANLLWPDGGFGGGGGFFGSILGALFGGARAGGGPVMANRAYLVGERGPEIVVPEGAGYVIPNHRLGGAGAGGAPPIYFDLRYAVTTEDLLRQMNAISRQHVRAGVAGYDRIAGARVEDYFARRG